MLALMDLLIQTDQVTQLTRAILYAIAAGVLYGLSGYFKRSDSTETFDGPTFITTMIIGVIAGILSYVLNLPVEQAFALVLAETGLVVLIENWAKAIWRRWIQPWVASQTPASTSPPPATTPPAQPA